MSKNCILGISTSGHGVGACVCVNGQVLSANTLERITRKKYDIMLPLTRTDLKLLGWNAEPQHYKYNIDLPFDLVNDPQEIDFFKVAGFSELIDHVLSAAGKTIKDVDCVAYGFRYINSVEKYFRSINPNIEFIVPEHHFAHACQAFLPSPFEEAAILIVDGQGLPLKRTNGDPLSGCLAHGRGNSIKVLKELSALSSLGSLYAHITKLCGFKTNEDGKTMGLAPYGTPRLYDKYMDQIRYKDGSFNLRDIARFVKNGFKDDGYLYTFGKLSNYLDTVKPRAPKGEFTDEYKDLAYMGQRIIEDVMSYLADWLYRETGSENLCIAGGVGLNCVANYKVFAKSKFKNVFVYPNCGDNGLCVGQALYAYNVAAGNKRIYISTNDYMGMQYSDADIKKAIDKFTSPSLEVKEYSDMNMLYEDMASLIVDAHITSWYQGRSEFGPRALGNRSILADPRRKDMKDILNSRVKFRESFRPFTPSVLEERANEFFTLDVPSPFMLLAPLVRPGKGELVPAITHVDNTARVQTVSKDVNERYYNLIKAFEKRTGIPMLLDTSFNVAGQPIVETPEDAIKCFLSTDIDALGIGNYLLKKVKK
ncbi:MAG: hypothetical protein A2204_01190 [Elusimicrobia bacterium RIFOXYA1_FULL_47_7]|nr:MAG: hypothetical protein A2204_01190 [Elusimicrobia bacterium RIFOXYA1_FULL_47_7]OGS32008.1 MAG: hypothetical protein A2323_08010 [Elusimicrobia bacterium RIFOXYB2_FULL_46_23]